MSSIFLDTGYLIALVNKKAFFRKKVDMDYNIIVLHYFKRIKFISFLQNCIHQGIRMFFRSILTSFKRFVAVTISQIIIQCDFAKIRSLTSLNIRINFTLNSFFSTFLRKNLKKMTCTKLLLMRQEIFMDHLLPHSLYS